jgi:hypothetical protein
VQIRPPSLPGISLVQLNATLFEESQTHMIAPSDTTEASLFLRVATNPPAIGTNWWLSSDSESRSPDWERIIAFALAENAVTVLNARMNTLPRGVVPADARERVARLALIWNFKLRLLERRLVESLAVLARADIEVVLLKGAALALTTYRGFVDRPMADIDLVVDAAKARRAWDLMLQTGWICDTSEHAEAAWTNHHHLPPLSDTSGSALRLEIHIAPIAGDHPFAMDFQDLRASSQELTIGGQRVRVPAAQFLAVHACIHFAWSHRFAGGRLNVFRDLAALHASGALSWDGLVAAAHRTHSEACCYWTLRLARALADLPVPNDILAELSPPLTARVRSVLEQHISQLVLRSECACPSAGLRDRMWALALQVTRPRPEEPARWGVQETGSPGSLRGPLRRVGAHILRVPRWSRYVTSLLPPALEVFS